MNPTSQLDKIIIFDTTMRDGELTPGVTMDLDRKLVLAQLLETIGVDVIEVGYPGMFEKDLAEVSAIALIMKQTTVCALAGSKAEEILKAAQGIQGSAKGRIHIYTLVNLKDRSRFSQEQVLEVIRDSIRLARNHCDDIEWSAFDGARGELDFVCRAIKTAIRYGATTINIPDSFGSLKPEKFSRLISNIIDRVPNIDRAIISVHCHDDLGLAVANSIAALDRGARQIECSINGLGARKGNADLAEVVRAISHHQDYTIDIQIPLLEKASELTSRYYRIQEK